MEPFFCLKISSGSKWNAFFPSKSPHGVDGTLFFFENHLREQMECFFCLKNGSGRKWKALKLSYEVIRLFITKNKGMKNYEHTNNCETFVYDC